ncbi:hypothetical protein LPB86_02270 [Pedobacter sp. MC2016-14]|uniref:hypothetical protein n=1 Tax=Pedobacter sp. MC2016-14 TaxID=2897327 RepID=UPI001E2D6CC3|nr:hypothetical protein [Pedobacter sp. MC2016-14]MCD0487036.1 hypothetical protein [Pedobacter sp. MC2016-14]
MKRLSNISPFILLLIPVFVMMIFTFTSSIQQHNSTEENAMKTSFQAPSLSKITAAIVK